MLPLISTFIFCVIDIMCFMIFFLTKFVPKCYALLLMAFDHHTIKVYLLIYFSQ